MPLPSPKLDDRKFQEIVDQAKRLIPQYCPEWTDHNVSDPGVALIELFAWMTDMVLYRTNQIPDKMLVQFLELLGVKLRPPSSAQANLTFYLSAALEHGLILPAGSEVSTLRTESSQAITFSTEREFTIVPPQIEELYKFSSSAAPEKAWAALGLREIQHQGNSISIFSAQPQSHDALYFAFQNDLSNHLLCLHLECSEAGWTGIDPTNPPWLWEVSSGQVVGDWRPCEVELDETGGFNRSGEIWLHLPKMQSVAMPDLGVSAYWLRVSVAKDAQGQVLQFKASPQLQNLSIESRGATVSARQATTVENEYLGQSAGTPGQTFSLRFQPVLASDHEKDFLIVIPPKEEEQRWTRVEDFAQSNRDSRHYTLDPLDGTITLGPALPQPDGTVYRFGQIPPKGSVLRFSRYQYGGGIIGNVPAGALSVLRTSLPFVAKVINREPAVGGAEAQTLEDAKVRLPEHLRTRNRAVTADDFEYLATHIEGVARARCLTPGELAQEEDGLKPGTVHLVILPKISTSRRPLNLQDFALSAELHRKAKAQIERFCLLGTQLKVLDAGITWVSVQITVRPLSQNTASHPELAAWIRGELDRYLDPYVGGPQGAGWPFGRSLHVSELYSLLQRNSKIDFIPKLKLISERPEVRVKTPIEVDRIAVPNHCVLCPREHNVRIEL